MKYLFYFIFLNNCIEINICEGLFLLYVLIAPTQPRYVSIQLLFPESGASQHWIQVEGLNAVNNHWLLFIHLTYGF